MSADNGVYILKLKNNLQESHDYLVKKVTAIENAIICPKVLASVFEDAIIYQDKDMAILEAYEIDKIERTEYGVCLITIFSKQSLADLAKNV